MSRDADAVSVPQFAARATDRCQAPESPRHPNPHLEYQKTVTLLETKLGLKTEKQV